MEYRKLKKKVSAILLATVMTVTAFPQMAQEVYATDNALPTTKQFATAEELKSFNTNDNDGEVNPAKVYFGLRSQQWWIAGSQQDKGLTLFAASPLATNHQFEPASTDIKTNSDLWADCSYAAGTTVTEVYPNHYGASPLRDILKAGEILYFTSAERSLMNETTIHTYDTRCNSVYSTINKLYLAYGDLNGQYITVGTNSRDSLNDGLRINKNYWGNSDGFWLRAPNMNYPFHALFAKPGSSVGVGNNPVDQVYALVPAFELNLSSVLFGSTVPKVSSNGQQNTNDAFTLRYSGKDLGSAQVSYDKSKANLSSVPSGTYLIAQNSEGAYAKQITNETTVSASDMRLSSFDNCKVWLETTDSAQRMTYATLATEEQSYTVNVSLSDGMELYSGSLIQKVAENQKIENIVIKAQDGYMFPTDYAVETQKGITVTRNSDNQITVSGTPTDNVTITLPLATKKSYSMALSGSGTFTETCVGYESVTANKFTITNTGNVDLENVSVSITGNDVGKFVLNWDNTSTISPNGTLNVTVKPQGSLAIGTYQATLTVSADNTNTVTTDLQFIVSEHDYNTVVTPPTCTEKGYTTYTCQKCNHSYTGNETNASGHTWGEWEIITSPTCEQSGSRKHTCEVCNHVETENLNPNGHEWEDDYTVDKEPACTEDGSKSIHCKNCEAVKDSEVISRLGHSFTNYVSNNDAACTKDGTKTAECDNGCGETDTVADTDSMLEHEFKNYVSDDNTTCTEDGTETAKCERCDETDTRIIENSALGHQWGEWKVIKEATTVTTGEKERICERCDIKETEVIPLISNGDTNNTDKTNDSGSNISAAKDKNISDTKENSPKTGDNTNRGLYTSLLAMSGLLIAILAVLRKKKAFGHK